MFKHSLNVLNMVETWLNISQTLLNMGIDHKRIECILDNDKTKQNKRKGNHSFLQVACKSLIGFFLKILKKEIYTLLDE